MFDENREVESIKPQLLNRETLSPLSLDPTAFPSLRRSRTGVDCAVANIKNSATSISLYSHKPLY